MGNHRAKRRLVPLVFQEGIKALQTKERKEGDNMVTYADLIQFCILIVALVSLCYKIFKDERK